MPTIEQKRDHYLSEDQNATYELVASWNYEEGGYHSDTKRWRAQLNDLDELAEARYQLAIARKAHTVAYEESDDYPEYFKMDLEIATRCVNAELEKEK